MDSLDRIQVDPLVCQGASCIKGTRILVSVVLDALSEGHSADWIVSQYRALTADDVPAAVAYGAWLARNLTRPLPPLEVKLDENMPVVVADILWESGYDAETVYSQAISGIIDPEPLDVSRHEHPILLTLDLNFTNIVDYPAILPADKF